MSDTISNIRETDLEIAQLAQLAEKMPLSARIYNDMTKGYHISTRDHRLYQELKQMEVCYVQWFAMLGLNLKFHPAGFYFLETDSEQLSDTSKQVAYIMLALIEYLGDRGLDVVQMVDQGQLIEPRWLDELYEKNSSRLTALKITSSKKLQESFNKTLKNKGFCSEFQEQTEADGYELHPPVHFYIDLCKRLAAAEDDAKKLTPTAAFAGSQDD